MVELLEGQTEWVHLLVAFPAILLPGHPHPRPQRVVRFVGELGVNGDRHVGNALAQQLLANPFATVDGVVVGIARHRKQPTRMGQNAHTVIGGHFVDALRVPIGEGECFGVVVFDLVDVSRMSLNNGLDDHWSVGSSSRSL